MEYLHILFILTLYLLLVQISEMINYNMETKKTVCDKPVAFPLGVRVRGRVWWEGFSGATCFL